MTIRRSKRDERRVQTKIPPEEVVPLTRELLERRVDLLDGEKHLNVGTKRVWIYGEEE